jgi:predicted DNA repair protein MutK
MGFERSNLLNIDDIATILDDVAVLRKFASKKTSGVIGDDLTVNAEQVHSVNHDREIPVVLAVMKALKNYFMEIKTQPLPLIKLPSMKQRRSREHRGPWPIGLF